MLLRIHLIPKAQCKNVRNICHHFVAKFFMPFYILMVVFFSEVWLNKLPAEWLKFSNSQIMPEVVFLPNLAVFCDTKMF